MMSSLSQQRMRDMYDDTYASSYLPKDSHGAYDRHKRFAKLFTTYEDLLDSLNRSEVDIQVKILGIFQLDSKLLYLLKPDDALLLVEAAKVHETRQLKYQLSIDNRIKMLQEPYHLGLMTSINIMRQTSI